MGRTARFALVCAVLAACLASTSTALAMKKTVCSSGCTFTSIQAAIDAASDGATITIGAGTYAENVLVDKPVTLQGAGEATVLEPATSNPVCSGGSLCGGSASNIILVQADNVTIKNMRLEGNNPSLMSGVLVGGQDIDARNGIITNHLAGKYNGLTVSRVSVSDIYLRGIYASSGGSFDFNHDTVKNVQAEEASIAMFAFEGTGEMDDNHVSEANDAISANWSQGTQFVGNVITKSGSGVHTDNNGGEGGAADLIKDNKVSQCKPNGYGIWVFVPYVSATVEANDITGCTVGLAAFGGAVSGQGPTFAGNRVNAAGASTSEGSSYGALVTTDQLGFEFGDVTATLTGNSLRGAGTGLLVTQTSPSPGQPAGGQANVTASGNAIYRNATGASGESGTVLEAADNWWGCSQGPTAAKCNPVTGTVSYTPWLTSKP